VTAREIAACHALGRAVLGTALTVAPGVAARAWIGDAARAPGTRVVTTAMGARDVALALGALRALHTGAPVSPWLAAGSFADAADLAATLRGRDNLPAVGTLAVTALAAASSAAGLWLARVLN
jgi:hypothetical protein